MMHYRVECRRQRGRWQTVQYESYRLRVQALAAQEHHRAYEDWDSVEVVAVEVERDQERRVVAAGARSRARTSHSDADDTGYGSDHHVADGEQHHD